MHSNGNWMNRDQREAEEDAAKARVRLSVSNAPRRRLAFAQIAEKDGWTVMHLSFDKLPGEEHHINIAISELDAIRLRDALNRQLIPADAVGIVGPNGVGCATGANACR